MNRSNNLLCSPGRSKASSDVNKGAYILVLGVTDDLCVTVGKLGQLLFAAGAYAYVGSAMGSAGFKRIIRHQDICAGRNSKHKWHIDYLLAVAQMLMAYTITTRDRIECDIATRLSASSSLISIKNFGSSDCKCRSHLFYSPRLRDIKNALESITLYYQDKGMCVGRSSQTT